MIVNETINNNKKELRSYADKDQIKDTDKFNKILDKIYKNAKRKYDAIILPKDGMYFRDIIIPDIYRESPLNKLKSMRITFDDLKYMYIFIRKLFLQKN